METASLGLKQKQDNLGSTLSVLVSAVAFLYVGVSSQVFKLVVVFYQNLLELNWPRDAD